MDISSSVLLGILQGLTEFLPISSSGHLVLSQNLLGLKEPQLLFDIGLHLGTLVAVCLFFRRDLKRMFLETRDFFALLIRREKGLRKIREYPHASMVLWVVIGTIPTGLIGLWFKSPLEALFGSLPVVGCMLIVTGFIVFVSRKLSANDSTRTSVGFFAAMAVGIAQGVAIIPGISRSGSTIVCGMACKLSKETAAKFSFLLSIPATLGAMTLQLGSEGLTREAVPVLATGFIASAFVGFFALKVLMGMLRKGHLYYFAPYCWAVGLLSLLISYFES
ncbi:MAG: undecaprenyl-diphosphate phosphatase [Deltaproteobacteria bacterium]|nr:undecaprenyl-diphosphate phosphatase [Deltaproteobacteria bacterium]